MKRIIILFSLFALCLSCASDVDIKETTGNLSGIVADKTTGEPVPVVSLTLEPGGKSTVTGSDGSFSFKDLEAGEYLVTISKKNYKENSVAVNVIAGRDVETHLLIERIPAFVTSDRTELDFGDNETLTTLSFNIINQSYEDLSWHIEYDKSESCFISSIVPENGRTKYGKTATVVVKIDRDKLVAGENISSIVVVSDNGDGSSEISIKAEGQGKYKPVLNTLDVSEVSSSSVRVNGKIIDNGFPEYTERGFVYSLNSMPTFDNTISRLTVPLSDDQVFSYKINGLTLGSKYFVRAYAVNKLGVAYSSNEVEFSPMATEPIVMTSDVVELDIANATAVCKGNIEYVGDPIYTERGFVYGLQPAPDINDSKVIVSGSGAGEFSAKIKNLELDNEYYVRAYVENVLGVYYGNEVSFVTATTSATVKLLDATSANTVDGSIVLHGDILNVGVPPYTEKGFVYSLSPLPTISDNKVVTGGSGSGAFETKVSGLALDTIYYLRAYVINESGVAYSEEEKTIIVATTPASVTLNDVVVTNVSDASAVLSAMVVDVGKPHYTEKGFVYSLTSNPTVNDNKVIVGGSGSGEYNVKVTDLLLDKTYYLRAYIINESGIFYSEEEKSFTVATTPPSVTLTDVVVTNVSDASAVLSAMVVDVGKPHYTEKGFVYSLTSNPTVNDNKVIVGGSGSGEYNVKVTDLLLDKTYYLRAYIINESGIFYSEEEKSFTVATTPPSVKLNEVTSLNATQMSACLNGEILNVGSPAYTEKGFVLGVHTLPTVNDTKISVPGATTGVFSHVVSDLTLDREYYLRAYVISNGKILYSSEERMFKISMTPPEVEMDEVSSISYNNLSARFNGRVINVGDPVYSELGFVYGKSSFPTVDDMKLLVDDIFSPGAYSGLAKELEANVNYYVRAYALSKAGVSYSAGQQIFRVAPILPDVSFSKITTDIYGKSAILVGHMENEGEPMCFEKGFVYSNTNSTPTIYDTKLSVDGNNLELKFDFEYDTEYHIRAYAANEAGVAYSQTKTIFVKTQKPSVTTKQETNRDLERNTTVLNGYISDAGIPAYTEKGFVYSEVYENPTISDSKFIVQGTATGAFEYRCTTLDLSKVYYVRAYAINAQGVAYGESIKIYNRDWVELPDVSIAIMKIDIGEGRYSSLATLCTSQHHEGFSDWRLPTLDELTAIYAQKDIIGGFYDTYYITGTKANSSQWYMINFQTGKLGYGLDDYRVDYFRARCVRTLD